MHQWNSSVVEGGGIIIQDGGRTQQENWREKGNRKTMENNREGVTNLAGNFREVEDNSSRGSGGWQSEIEETGNKGRGGKVGFDSGCFRVLAISRTGQQGATPGYLEQ